MSAYRQNCYRNFENETILYYNPALPLLKKWWAMSPCQAVADVMVRSY